MRSISVVPEYVSRIDRSVVQALKIRAIELDPRSGRMILRFYDRRFPEMITCAKACGMPAPNTWLVKDDQQGIRFISDLEFGTEFRPLL